ncbi:hypothetical protein HMPREF0326_03190 [Desulfovibrio sp. 3_1_syn3]|uniref:hypothetical protein n=1 Tax=Desulfovibrio sp. 3_1_syn3 TaxID=457398 RepID=UPI0001E12F1A|nr:hypothetical protein [Desulfovibrio sp. 3_1_syn3]EFL84273.1 hypothetical protein HMPREF0326_03190 [Desulfovibrio sp. 3_1_syn3]
MAIRIQQYSAPPRHIQAGDVDPGFSQPLIRDAGRSADADLTDAMLKAGMRITEVGVREYVSRETTRVSQSLLRMQGDLSAERDRYMAEHQGQNAINAGEHFRSFADEAMRRHLEDGQFSGRFRQMFARQAVATGLHFTEQGQAYGRQQKETWEGSVLKGELAHFETLVAKNYDNPELITYNLGQLQGRIKDMRPGLDNREMFQQLDSLAAKGRLDGMLADGRYDEAERLMGGGTGSGGTIAETFRNPLNLKKAGANTGTRDDFRQFGSYAEGFGAAWDQLKTYQSRDGLTTPRRMAGKWAPVSDGNDQNKYVAALRSVGLDPDAEIDVNDPGQAALLMKGMALAESPVGKRFSKDDIAAMLATGKDAPAPGQLEAGNINLFNRPVVKNADGTISTVRSMSANFDGKEVLLPTVSDDGKILSNEEAVEQYRKTGKHLGIFDSPEHATAYAKTLHEDQERLYVPQDRQAPGLAGLTPADRLKYQGQIRTARRERVLEAGLTASAFENQISYGMDKGDFSAAEATVAKLEGMGAHKEAGELSEKLAVSKQARTALDGTQGLPLLEQAAAAKNDLDALITPGNAKAVVAMREKVDSVMEKRKSAFIKDPAGYVAILPAMQGEMDFQERVRRSLALQEETGKGLGFTPRVLPDAESKRLRAVYDKQTTPEGRLQNLRGLQQQGGIYSQRMLTEMKMPESVVAIAPALPILPDKDSGLWLTAAEIKPSDIPNVNEDAKKNARDAIANSSAMSFFYGMARKFPTNTVLRDLAKNMEATVQNALLLGMEPGALDKAWSSETSDNCLLLIPKNANIDASDAETALASQREEIAARLMREYPKSGDAAKDRTAMANRRALAREGVFVSSNNGLSASLLDPWTGDPVFWQDGSPVTVDLNDALAAALSEEEEDENDL